MQTQLNLLQRRVDQGNDQGRGPDRGQGRNRNRQNKYTPAENEVLKARRTGDQCLNCGSADHYLRECTVVGIIRPNNAKKRQALAPRVRSQGE